MYHFTSQIWYYSIVLCVSLVTGYTNCLAWWSQFSPWSYWRPSTGGCCCRGEWFTGMVYPPPFGEIHIWLRVISNKIMLLFNFWTVNSVQEFSNFFFSKKQCLCTKFLAIVQYPLATYKLFGDLERIANPRLKTRALMDSISRYFFRFFSFI